MMQLEGLGSSALEGITPNKPSQLPAEVADLVGQQTMKDFIGRRKMKNPFQSWTQANQQLDATASRYAKVKAGFMNTTQLQKEMLKGLVQATDSYDRQLNSED